MKSELILKDIETSGLGLVVPSDGMLNPDEQIGRTAKIYRLDQVALSRLLRGQVDASTLEVVARNDRQALFRLDRILAGLNASAPSLSLTDVGRLLLHSTAAILLSWEAGEGAESSRASQYAVSETLRDAGMAQAYEFVSRFVKEAKVAFPDPEVLSIETRNNRLTSLVLSLACEGLQVTQGEVEQLRAAIQSYTPESICFEDPDQGRRRAPRR